MKRTLDDLLTEALLPDVEPDIRLDQEILNQAKERSFMGKRHFRISAAMVTAACLMLAVGSVTAVAAYRYLNPVQVAQKAEDEKLSAAFSSEDAVWINETQEFKEYKITFLGYVAGKNISDYFIRNGHSGVLEDRIYAVTGIEKADGSPMPETSSDEYNDISFFESFYIGGLNPAQYNAASMNGNYTEYEEDGILYRIIDMNNIEVFADQEIYLGVNDGFFYDPQAFEYDGTTGTMCRNEAYDGVNALFSVPMDASKADPKAALEFLNEMEEQWNSSEEPEMDAEYEDIYQGIEEFMAKVDAALETGNLLDYMTPIEETIQTCKVNAEGVFSYAYDLGDHGSGSGSGFINEHKSGDSWYINYSWSEDGVKDLRVDVVTLNEDGTVTYALYVPVS